MRVIAGTSRGRRLKEFKGQNVRPTPDRVRESLFNILQSRLGSFDGLKVLDLFAGSGALAIEALSRGAASASLVEKDHSAGKTICENIERCHFEGRTVFVARDAFAALTDFHEPFDLVFLDPPYNMGLAIKAASEIDKLGLLSPEGILCIETAAKESLPNEIGTLKRLDQRRYGSVMIHFYSIPDEGLS